jgi:hypothetical protein
MKAVNIFRTKMNKIKLKEANTFSDHRKLYIAGITE